MIKLNDILAVSNGVDLSGVEGMVGSNSLCQYKLVRSKYLPIFVVITDFICGDTPSEIIAAIDSGKFDLKLFRTFKGHDAISELRKNLIDKIKQEEAKKRFEVRAGKNSGELNSFKGWMGDRWT